MQAAVDAMMDRIERNHLRDKQKTAHLCIAECFDNKRVSADQVQRCTAECGASIHNVQQVIAQEMNDFQQRIHRCAQDCHDQAKDDIPANATEVPPKVEAKLQKCSIGCIDKHMKLLTTVEDRIVSATKM
ncbi:unnamed protein product [Chrysoparadoxa australica]